jgi:hypothetical protein
VIPVLVQGASMPSADEVPEDLAPLTRRNAFELHDTSWRYDIRRLITVIERTIKGDPAATPDEPEEEGPQESPEEPQNKRPIKKRVWWSLGVLGVILMLTSIYGLYQIINPQPFVTDSRGALSDITVHSGSTFITVGFKALIAEDSGKKYEIRWTLYDANTGNIFPDPNFQDQHAMYMKIDYLEEVNRHFKIPYPFKPGSYYVRLTLLAPKESGGNTPLDLENSETFRYQSSSSSS